MGKKIPNLGPAEWDVLRVLWEHGEASARDVAEILRKQRPIAQTTVATLLTRLQTKGLVRHRKSERGKTFLFSAKLEPSAVKSSVLKRFVRQLFGDDVVSAVLTLVDGHDLSQEEIQRLRETVARGGKGRTKKSTKGRRR